MVKILNERQISQKIRRLAIEITEENWESADLVLLGINNNGYHFATILGEAVLTYNPDFRLQITRIRLDPADPLAGPAALEQDETNLTGKPVILVDDVANTGRTLFYAFRPLMDVLPAKIQTAVLVERHHKTFPVQVDYVGMRLATTLQEHIHVQLQEERERAVFLD